MYSGCMRPAQVKIGVLQNLAAFLSVLSPPTRLQYLPVLVELRAETDNWRFRQLLSSQLAALGAAFSRGPTLQTLLPLALDLCTDTVAEVRIASPPHTVPSHTGHSRPVHR